MTVEPVLHRGAPVLSKREQMRRLIGRTAARYGVTVEEILGKSRGQAGRHTRTKPIVQARWACWAAVQAEFGLDYSGLARVFGRHHSTIQHGLEHHRRRAHLTPKTLDGR